MQNNIHFKYPILISYDIYIQWFVQFYLLVLIIKEGWKKHNILKKKTKHKL